MLDPLQNILNSMDTIVQCRTKGQTSSNPNTRMFAMVGEMDNLEEIYRQLEVLNLNKRIRNGGSETG